MANQHRRAKRAIRGAIKKLKRGEVPYPPPPRVTPPSEESEFWRMLEDHRRRLLASLKSLERDGSRQGHKKRLAADAQLQPIEELLKART